MWAITARFAHYQRCTNCSRRYCMEDCTQCLTKIKQKINRTSEKLTRQRIILRHTECCNRNAKSAELKCVPRRWTSEDVWLHLPQFYLGDTPILQCRSWIRLSLEENLQRSEDISTDRRREWNFRYPKRLPNRVIRCPVCCSTRMLQYALKNVIQRWQNNKDMEIYLSDQERDCLTNLRFADDVMKFPTSKEQIRNMMCEFKDVTEKVGLRIHPDKTKILSNQSNINYDTKRYIKIGEMSIEILTKSESMKYLGQRISFHQQETLKIKKQDQSSLDDISQIQTGIDIKEIHAQTPSPTLRLHSPSDSWLRSRYMDTEPRT